MNTAFAHKTKTTIAGAALLAGTIGLSGCINISSGFDGEPLAEFDQGGSAPTEISLAGPDDIVLAVGDSLSIEVEGDPDVIETLRFRRTGDSLGVGRDSDGSSLRGKAIIRVTMPAPEGVSIGGSGDIRTETLADKADIAIGGSGSVVVDTIASDRLEIAIGGKGSVSGSGTVKRLEIAIGGSGDINFEGVKADDVEISIAGSGDIELASDGKVEASIVGSGDIVVTGNATCNSTAVGSGNLTCTPGAKSASAAKAIEADEAE